MKNVWYSILFLFPLCSLAQGSSIDGRIYALDNHRIIANAKLILKQKNIYYKKTKTDQQGNYNFLNLPQGNYSIEVYQEGYCQLEMQAIILADSQAIQLDLGLTTEVMDSFTSSVSRITTIYQKPIIFTQLKKDTLAYQSYQNKYNIINEVYEGPQIRIIPYVKPSPPLSPVKATHYNDTFQALEKKKNLY